jgi:hypothetical protein
VEPADELGPQPAQIVIALGQQPHDLGVISPLDGAKTIRAQSRDGDREGVVGIVLLRTPGALEAKVGGTSSTTSPASTSCWASR